VPPPKSVVTIPSWENDGSSVPSARTRATKKSANPDAAPTMTILPSACSAAAFAAPCRGTTIWARPSPLNVRSNRPLVDWRATDTVPSNPPTVTTLPSGCASTATFDGRNVAPLPYGPNEATISPGTAPATPAVDTETDASRPSATSTTPTRRRVKRFTERLPKWPSKARERIDR
jgi:hypothetical protein